MVKILEDMWGGVVDLEGGGRLEIMVKEGEGDFKDSALNSTVWEGGLQAAAASTALPVTAEAGALVTAEGTAVKTSTEHGVV